MQDTQREAAQKQLEAHLERLRALALEDMAANRRFFAGLAAASVVGQATILQGEGTLGAVAAGLSALALVCASLWMLRFEDTLKWSYDQTLAELRQTLADLPDDEKRFAKEALSAKAKKPSDRELLAWKAATVSLLVLVAALSLLTRLA